MIVKDGSVMLGRRWAKSALAEMFGRIQAGQCDCAVASLTVAAAGLNCQSLNAVVFLSPCTSDAYETQAKGKSDMDMQLTKLRMDCESGPGNRGADLDRHSMPRRAF